MGPDDSVAAILSDLKDKIVTGASPQLQTKLDQAEQERDAANAKLDAQKDYDTIKNERDQLQQQLEAIKTELGLKNDAAQQQIIDKIKELKGRPTNTDYGDIKSQRDSLQTQVNNLQSITLSNEQRQKIQTASTANEVETTRNEIIKGEFGRLKGENASSDRLNKQELAEKRRKLEELGVQLRELESKNKKVDNTSFFTGNRSGEESSEKVEEVNRNYFDKEIIFDGDELKFNQAGELVITGYPNLEKILNTENKEIKNITKITISDCPKLKIVDINNFTDNQKLDIINCPGLEKLAYKYTVEVKGVLIDPGVKIDEMINQAQQMDMMVHMNAMVANSIANLGNAFSGGISVSPAITAPSPITEEVPVNGIKQKFASPEVQVSEPVDNLISDFSQQLTITPTDYEEKNEEGIERMEQEITKLEEEISKLKLEQKQQQTQIEIPPK
ncbi:861_t:CDS:2 [Cetraspora pellucida]|uniref:861_t:CDS:1 n=1 Tax=Cetraspora pellucida TaxID=1433469 RepID=A0ACA9KNG2_9GLOM|nr:861_t:CDS:2 [Cetraspora pellucida]